MSEPYAAELPPSGRPDERAEGMVSSVSVLSGAASSASVLSAATLAPSAQAASSLAVSTQVPATPQALGSGPVVPAGGEAVSADVTGPTVLSEANAEGAGADKAKLDQLSVPLTQKGPGGVQYDFQDGCRVWVPGGAKWRIRLRDVDSDCVVFDQTVETASLIQSAKRYYVPYEITLWKNGEQFFYHVCALKGQEVLVTMHLGGVGDHLAWFGHVAAFAARHGCRMTCRVSPVLAELLAPANPDIRFVTEAPESVAFYAAYRVLVFFEDKAFNHQPNDYRQSGLAHMGAYILGLPPVERCPAIHVEEGGRPLAEPYVCIAAQASGLSKYWNNPDGWYRLVRWLKEKGYRVVCIDRARLGGSAQDCRLIPHGVEDETGDRPLSERARWLKHADFFVGVSSGLSWLAWAAGTPVVMISGFTEPYNEFSTPYRVINRHVCTGCANDVTVRLDPEDPYFCPHHKGTSRAFECGRSISPVQVQQVIETIPGFGKTARKTRTRKPSPSKQATRATVPAEQAGKMAEKAPPARESRKKTDARTKAPMTKRPPKSMPKRSAATKAKPASAPKMASGTVATARAKNVQGSGREKSGLTGRAGTSVQGGKRHDG